MKKVTIMLALVAIAMSSCKKRCYYCEKDHPGYAVETSTICGSKDLRAAKEHGMNCNEVKD